MFTFTNSLYTFAVLALTSFTTVSASCSNANTSQGCAAGCYNAEGQVFAGGVIHCEPVDAGFYSPNGSNQRFLCSQGQYSNDPEASSCQLCAPGTIAGGRGSTSCLSCPTGFYQPQYGQFTCLQCSPLRYNGPGSNAVEFNADRSEIYCALVGLEEPSASPSASPSTMPSPSPSLSPSRLPSVTPTSEPSWSPSRSPSTKPSISPSMGLSEVPTSLPTLLSTLLPTSLPTLLPTLTASSVQYDAFAPNTPSLSPNVAAAVDEKNFATLLLGVAIAVVIVAVVGFGVLYVKRSRRDEQHDNDAVVVTIGGELNQDNAVLDSELETREEREYNDALDDIEAAMESIEWSADDDLALKKGSLTCTKNNNDVVLAFAQVVSVECYGDEKNKKSHC